MLVFVRSAVFGCGVLPMHEDCKQDAEMADLCAQGHGYPCAMVRVYIRDYDRKPAADEVEVMTIRTIYEKTEYRPRLESFYIITNAYMGKVLEIFSVVERVMSDVYDDVTYACAIEYSRL